MDTTYYTIMKSPLGALLLAGNPKELQLIDFQAGSHPHNPKPEWKKAEEPFREVIQQLKSYFAGELREFRLKLAFNGTPFQKSVWSALQKIPYGQTWSYSDLAQNIGRPKAVRAVGAANGRNPLPIVIPCHRVIGKNGGLTGFAGGLDLKETLLALEAGPETVGHRANVSKF